MKKATSLQREVAFFITNFPPDVAPGGDFDATPVLRENGRGFVEVMDVINVI